MRARRCASCKEAVEARFPIELALIDVRGRAVTLVLHDRCGTLLQGVIAFQQRYAAVKTAEAIARRTTERSTAVWLPDDVRDLRARMGLTQRQLAERLGVSPQTVYLHERPDADPWYGMGLALDALDAEVTALTGATLNDWRADLLAAATPTV